MLVSLRYEGRDVPVPEGWFRARDLDPVHPERVTRMLNRLVALDRLERVVRKEWDKQRSAASSHLFGGAGVMKRRRAYYRRKEA